MQFLFEKLSTIVTHPIVFLFGKNFEKSFPYAVALVLIALIFTFRRRAWKFQSIKLKLKSMSASTIIYFVNLLAFAPVVLLTESHVQAAYEKVGLPHLDPAIWQGIPVWLLVIFALLAFDFADYWSHRLMHKSWLWPVHAIHHSETDMTGLTTYRVHFIEPIIMGITYVVLLTWLGLPDNVFGYGAIAISLHNVYVHMDMDWGHGPFRHVLASPRYHRWHHANVPAAYGKNLANIFPIYDVAFGTYYMPGTCTARLGADGVPENDVIKLLLHPFREWGRMLRAVAGFARVKAGHPEIEDDRSQQTP